MKKIQNFTEVYKKKLMCQRTVHVEKNILNSRLIILYTVYYVFELDTC